MKETTASLGCVSEGYVCVNLGFVSRGVSEGYVCMRELGLCECGPATSSKVLSFIWSVLRIDPGTRNLKPDVKKFPQKSIFILKILVTLFSLIYYQFSNKR